MLTRCRFAMDHSSFVKADFLAAKWLAFRLCGLKENARSGSRSAMGQEPNKAGHIIRGRADQYDHHDRGVESAELAPQAQRPAALQGAAAHPSQQYPLLIQNETEAVA